MTGAIEEPAGNQDDLPARLTLIGYWAGPETAGAWPSPEDFVDSTWDEDERDFVASYLRQGQVVRNFMGYSPCRICSRNNGDLELSDGTFLWPDGLSHYVRDHGVRLPDAFVQHTYARIEAMEQARSDVEWWRGVSPVRADGLVQIPVTLPTTASSPGPTVFAPSAGTAGGRDPLHGRESVVEVVQALLDELTAGGKEPWENDTLESFLDAFGNLLPVMENAYRAAGRKVPDDPWVVVADALRGARYDE